MPPRHTRPVPQPRGTVTPVYRGPQAASVPATAAQPYHAPNAALLIDFDNVTMGIRSDLASELKTLLSSEIVRGKVSVQRAYADWRRYPQYIVPLAESSIDLIYAPAYGSSKKNATDIRLAIDALELVFTRPEIGTFILLSGDSDFSSLVLKLKEYGKYVIGVGIRESASDLLVQNCDEYYSYNTLAGLVNTRDEEVVKWDPWELAGEAVQRMTQNGDVMRADRLKQVMQHIDSSFDEKNLGMSKFSRFITEAAKRGIVSLNKMENGQYEVALPEKPLAAAGGVASVEPSAKVASDESGVATPERRRDERPREDRGSRVRGRRGRGRDERRPAAAITADAETSKVAAPASAPVDVPAQAPRPTSAPVSSKPAVPDTIGVAGMRLTRDEAFELVRGAVSQVTPTGSGRVSAVRTVARELLGRDSESLSERNFVRILKDAHDAGFVDLRRKGDDYSVALAVAADPISEQLAVAEVSQTPVVSAAAQPVAPRGMGPRGISGRGRGRGPAAKNGVLSPDLLSLGIVEDVPAITPSVIASPASTAVVRQADGVEVSSEKTASNSTTRSNSGRGGRGRQRSSGRPPARREEASPAKTAAKAPVAEPEVANKGRPAAPARTGVRGRPAKTVAAKTAPARTTSAKAAPAKTVAKSPAASGRKTAAKQGRKSARA